MKPLFPRHLQAFGRLSLVIGPVCTALLRALAPRTASAGAPIRATYSLGCRSRARVIGLLLVLLAGGWFAPGTFAATGTCGAAASQGANGPADYSTYCWIDFSGYNNTTASSAGGRAFTITLTGGSTLSFTLNVTGPALTSATVPTWTGAALGQSAFVTIPGKPALYQTTGAGTTTVTLSNLVLTVGSGTVPYAIVAADAESTNGGETLSFTTNGNPWTLLASMAYTCSTVFPTLGGVNTTTVTETGVNGNVGAYAFATQGSPTTISSTMLGSGLQGIAFAVKFHAVDMASAAVQSGGFAAGGTGTYTLTATNNGPDTYSTPDTITVTDTLPTGLTYNPTGSGGTGWTCGAVGQLVTCTVSATVASGAALPAITLNVNVANTVASSVTNTATVADNPTYDYNTTNNTATNTTTIVEPNLTTSTKTVVNTGGGDALVGSTLQYTITLTESAGAVAAGVSVTDNVPANLSGFTASAVTVTGSSTTVTNASTNTGGTNADGLVSISNITVPANGTVTIVFTAQVASGTANCTTIDNTGTITNPNGSTTTVSVTAPTIVVAQSFCASSGNKLLYLTGTIVTGTTEMMSRQPPTTNTTVSIASANGQVNWEQQTMATKSIVIPAQTVSVALYLARTGGGGNRTIKVALAKNSAPGTLLGSTTQTITLTTAEVLHTFTFAITATTVTATAPTDALLLEITNTTTGANNPIVVYPLNGTSKSAITFDTSTVINVDSVTAYSSAYPVATPPTGGVFPPSQSGPPVTNVTVYICAVISDPFGYPDIDPTTGGTAPTITLTDPNGTVRVSNANMTKETGANCSGIATTGTVTTTTTATLAFEYAYTLPIGVATGFWTAQVTGYEGTEGTISQTSNGSFYVAAPNLLIMKTVSVASDPAEGTTNAKAIPGANVLYTILVQNNGHGPVDSGTLVITDPVPAKTGFYLSATTPFGFTDGSPVSGLSAPVMTFSNNGGSTYVYSPTCSRPCTDTTITNFKITFTGSMNGESVTVGSTAPSFTITYNDVIQ